MTSEAIMAVAALASALAAVLAWAAKLWWGRKHIAAKNETSRAKDAEIEVLKMEVDTYRELTPLRIREYFTSVTAQLEEYNEAPGGMPARVSDELTTRAALSLFRRILSRTSQVRGWDGFSTNSSGQALRVSYSVGRRANFRPASGPG